MGLEWGELDLLLYRNNVVDLIVLEEYPLPTNYINCVYQAAAGYNWTQSKII